MEIESGQTNDARLSILKQYCVLVIEQHFNFQYHRAKELELSQRKLFETIDQLNAKVHLVENANLRVKGKLQDMQGELRDLVSGTLLNMR